MHGVPRSPGLRPASRPDSRPAALVPAALQRPIVLVVDDDGVRDALHVILDDSYTVVDVADGPTAVGIIRERRVDLVLLDILLPDVDGIEILQEIRGIARELPVIMMTAVRTVVTAVAAMKLGAADYITKPFAEASLLAAIRAAIEERGAPRPLPEDPWPSDAVVRLPRPHRVLLVEGDLGWRATIAVALDRAARVETAPTLEEALNQVLSLRPTCVVLNARRTSAQAARFLVAVHAQLPGCRVLVLSEDPHLQATLAWESLNIRAMLPPSIDPGELLGRIAAMTAPPGDAGPWPRLSRPIGHAVAYLAAHFGDDLKVDRLAEAAGISGSHLAHLFRAETGTTVRHFLSRVRVEITRDLLRHTDESLTEIAVFAGFFDASHLSRVFRRILGQRPSAYRRATSLKAPVERRGSVPSSDHLSRARCPRA